MKTKILSTMTECKEFAEKCDRKLELNYPIDFLLNAKVRAFYNRRGEMIGGYVLNYNNRFRVIESLPDHVKRDSPWVSKEVLSNTYEVTGLWLDHESRDIGTSFVFWFIMYKDMIMTRRKYLVYAYDTDKTHLKRLYSNLRPSTIFTGKTIIQKGMATECVESVEIATVRHLRMCMLYRLDFFVRKLINPMKKRLTFLGHTMSHR
jgi:hypothetical protein